MLRLVIVLVLVGVAGACARSRVTNKVINELSSPDGERRAVLFCRDGGATTGFNTQASIIGRNEILPDEPGNVFVIDRGVATVEWKGDGGLLVVIDRGARSFKRETSVRGVPIEYREK